jgi:hypothetical protein
MSVTERSTFVVSSHPVNRLKFVGLNKNTTPIARIMISSEILIHSLMGNSPIPIQIKIRGHNSIISILEKVITDTDFKAKGFRKREIKLPKNIFVTHGDYDFVCY